MKLEDIAKKVGVSRSTVSRVINNQPYVGERTRQRVMKVIEQEQFQPDPAARALVTGRTEIIGVAIPQVSNVFFGDNSYFPMLMQGIAETTIKRDYAMLLWLAHSHEERDGFSERVSKNRQPDGLIIASVTEIDPLFSRLINMKRTFVMVETPPRFDEIVNYVTIDNVRASELVVEHLVSLGYRRIATITGQLNIRDGADRLKGYKNGLEKAGLPLDPTLIYPGQFSRDFGYEGMKHLLPLKPDAVVCGGDTVAIGAIEAIQEAGLRVPDDVAIVGFDDLDVAIQSDPPLTTIRHSVQRVGEVAAQLLIDLIEGKVQPPHHIVLPTELVVRQSSDPNAFKEVMYPIGI
ncbi:MAG: LacI family DNA-binding transcriptional regulator [Chloroflexota bacterium]